MRYASAEEHYPQHSRSPVCRIEETAHWGTACAAILAVTVCKRAWNVARRNKPAVVRSLNPFYGMKLRYQPQPTRAVTHAELLRFVKAADEQGQRSIGTAAMIAYYWLQREGDILKRLGWSHYRPTDDRGIARIFHHKTGE